MELFDKIKKLWNERGFEIVLGLCVAFILIFALYRKITGCKGTWSNEYHSPYTKNYKQLNQKTKRFQPDRKSKGEAECRRVLEYIFNKPFPSVRPDFLRNPVTSANYNLELDCYNEQLRLACEYNGRQHYEFIPFFHKNKEAFMNQKYRDDMKNRICRENGIILITVPYTVELKDIKKYIEKELKRAGYKF